MININKKAASLTFQTIIIAALAIIVLLVLIYLLVGTSGDADKALACTKKGGICMETCEGIYSDDSLASQDLCDADSGKQCCLPGV